MGGCASSEKTSRARGSASGVVVGGKRGQRRDCNQKLPKTTQVIHVDGGWVQELKQPVQAKAVTSQNPSCFLCSYESLSIGTCAPHLPGEEELQPGHIYFLMPLSRARQPLSLPDLCSMAITATTALGHNAVDFSLRSSFAGDIQRKSKGVFNSENNVQPNQPHGGVRGTPF